MPRGPDGRFIKAETTLNTALAEVAATNPAVAAAADYDNPRRVKLWSETVRPWQGPGDTGIELVTTTSPDMIGIKFPDNARATTNEKLYMLDNARLTFNREAQAYLAHVDRQNRGAQHDQVQAVYEAIVESRREQGRQR